MNHQSLADFTRQIREQLQKVAVIQILPYLDLAEINTLDNLEKKLAEETCCQDPFEDLQEIIYNEITQGHLGKVKIAVNELLKFYLTTIRPETEESCTQQYLKAIERIFRGCFGPSFPFLEELWVYLNHALKTAGLFLLARGYPKGLGHILESLSLMGRLAAQKGLSTTATQSCLRILEITAAEKGYSQVASYAKNFRFNLETN